MKRVTRWTLVIGGIAALACSGGDKSGEGGELPPPPPPPDPIEEPPPPPDPVEEPTGSAVTPGKIPYDFPVVETTAKEGQFVLAPSRQCLDDAIAKDGQGTFIFYGADMVTPGEAESAVRSLAGTDFTIPNSLIVPIKPGYAAKKGDIVLTQWESGSGMQRAIVTGGTPEAPVVRYLDMDYENPSGIGQKDDTLKANRFHALTDVWQVGTSVACKDGADYRHGILLALAEQRVLVSGFAGSIQALSKADCVSLPPRTSFKEGQLVQIPVVGRYVQGTVTRIDGDIGRVFVKYEWGGAEKEGAFSIADVTPDFEQRVAEGAPTNRPPSNPNLPSLNEAREGKAKMGKIKAGKGKSTP